MPLLDRYLTAVKFWLPKNQRHDIAAELAANLQSEIDDRAATLGRSLTDDEIAALLKEHGAPIVVASRYRQENRTVTFGRQIIGPVLFPFYWIAVKVSLVLLLIPAVVPSLVLNLSNPPRDLAHVFHRSLQLALPTLFLVTLLFAMIEACLTKFHLLEKWTNEWDPRRLPCPERHAKQVRRSSSIAGIIAQSIFILWWLRHSSFPYLVISNGDAQIHTVPIWAALHLPILIFSFICLAQDWINLAQPGWRWLPPVTHMLVCLGSLIVLYPMVQASPLVTFTLPNEQNQLARILPLNLEWVCLGIMIVGVVYAWRLVWIVWDSLPRTQLSSRSEHANGVPLA